ncbi:MAG: hypothetical protein IPK69_05910 [Phycisphaerales bacterium]|nr:MAG: hypothetical protein IPK69_05910 [Phycisphaerales bacterium]
MFTRPIAALVVLALASSALAGETHRFSLANVGMSYSAFLSSASPLVGRQVQSARIEIHLSVAPGSNAADFHTDIALPIEEAPGQLRVFVFDGIDENWSGEGPFTYFETTTALNGTIVPTRYGAETYGIQGQFTNESFIEITLASEVPLCPADLDNGSGTGTPDGAITIDDLLFFLDRFAAGDLAADLDDGTSTGTPDTAVTIDDLLYMIDHFQAGC